MPRSISLHSVFFATLLFTACGGDDLVIPPPSNNGGDSGGGGGRDTTGGGDDGGEADTEDDGTTTDGGGGTDSGTDSGEVDVGDVVEPVDEAPRLVNAFSKDGEDVVARFSEEVDETTGGTVANYRIVGSDNSELTITAVEVDGRFAFMTLDLTGTAINPDLTYELIVRDVMDLTGNPIDTRSNRATVRQPLFLNIIWHQHQPLYLDPNRDEMIGPWVRKHATKDYWDMTAILQRYPGIHLTVNLTSVLLIQNEFYVDRLGPYVDPVANTIDETEFLAEMEGHTDAFIDLLLRDTPTPESATEEELGLFYADPWATVSTSDAIMQRFPEYVALRDKARDSYTQLDFAYLKIWFEVAWFDPDFLQGPVRLTNGWTVDLSDVVDLQPNGTYLLDAFYTSGAADDAERLARLEVLANRLVAENYKIMADVVPLHRSLIYNAGTNTGRVEVITTPFFHPILPLIHDTNLAQHAQPTDLLPNPAYQFPLDAFAQVAMARRYYRETFGQEVRGMWPGEGSVAEEIVGTLVDNHIEWIATDQGVLERSDSGAPHHFPYRIDADTVAGDGGSTDDELVIVFRDGPLSDNIGFAYQTLTGTAATDDFMGNVLAQAPRFGQSDRLLTVVLDGENAWEMYRLEHDGKGFHHALYTALEESQEVGELITVTPAEYIHGNLDRGVAPHPTNDQRELEPLWRGSWIDSSYATWIGESEENLAWNYLLQARADLERSGLPRPNPTAPAPSEDDAQSWAEYNAYLEIYAAEGSDWFWWYGQDQTSASNDDTPFDRAFRSHLTGMYDFMNQALTLRGESTIPVPDFGPIIQPRAGILQGPFDPVPVVDGKFLPDESEWSAVAGSFFDNDSSGTAASLNDDIALVYYGYNVDEESPDEQAVFVALQFNEDLSDKLGTSYTVSLYMNYKHILDEDLGTFEPNPQVLNTETPEGGQLNFMGGGAGWRIVVDFSGESAVPRLEQADGSGGWTARDLGGIEVGGPVEGGRVLEFGLPWTDLGMAFGDPFEFSVVASEGSTIIDQAPQLESRIVFDDVTNLVIVVFECDVTGSTVPIDTYTPLSTQPPPAGTGNVYITGNQPVWGDWWPNSLSMLDDGESPDRVAGDGIYTRSFQFRPGLLLRWKYTIGTPTDEGRWSGTEEFPLTERGITLPDAPTTLILHEIFADRPQPTGSTAPGTVVEDVND